MKRRSARFEEQSFAHLLLCVNGVRCVANVSFGQWALNLQQLNSCVVIVGSSYLKAVEKGKREREIEREKEKTETLVLTRKLQTNEKLALAYKSSLACCKTRFVKLCLHCALLCANVLHCALCFLCNNNNDAQHTLTQNRTEQS